MKEQSLTYTEMKDKTGLTILYEPHEDGSATLQAVANGVAPIEAVFSKSRIDEAHILYMEVTELLRSRAKMGEDPAGVRETVEKLFALFRGEKVSFPPPPMAPRAPSGDFIPNPGKVINIDVDGVTYARLPVRTRLITMQDNDIQPLLDDYVKPYLKPDDVLYISEKALTITQGRIVDMGTFHPSWLAHLFARNVGNNYGSNDFKGFGHGTAIAMQAFIDEAGYARIIFAALVSAITRPLGIRGLFYRICGLRAKSIDCPMSFLILEYAHSVKLAPNDPSGAARAIKEKLGGSSQATTLGFSKTEYRQENLGVKDVVILDANYRGAFSLGKSSSTISESFIGKLFRDNPLGQSDEMTPFCIVRKA